LTDVFSFTQSRLSRPNLLESLSGAWEKGTLWAKSVFIYQRTKNCDNSFQQVVSGKYKLTTAIRPDPQDVGN